MKMLANKYFQKKQEISTYNKLQEEFNKAQSDVKVDKVLLKAVSLIHYDEYIVQEEPRLSPHVHDDTKNSHSNRILDSIARMFYCTDDSESKLTCCAVALQVSQDSKTLYFSYNNNKGAEKAKTSVNKLYGEILKEGATKESLIEYCLQIGHYFYLFEGKTLIPDEVMSYLLEQKSESPSADKTIMDDIIKFLGNIKNLLPLANNEKAEGKYTTVSYAEFNNKRAYVKCEQESLCEAIRADEYLDTQKKDALCDIVIQIAERKLYFWNRLEHDCTKLLNCRGLLLNTSIDLLANPKKTHCELNVLKKLKHENAVSYIGISKLSCAVCHKQLTLEEAAENKVLHAGGGGLIWHIDDLPHEIIFDTKTSLGLFHWLITTAKGVQCKEENHESGIDNALQYKERFSLIEEVDVVQTTGELPHDVTL